MQHQLHGFSLLGESLRVGLLHCMRELAALVQYLKAYLLLAQIAYTTIC